jgi:hypothetical protein
MDDRALPTTTKSYSVVTTGAGLTITTGSNLSETSGTIVTWVASHGDTPGVFTGKREACWVCGLEYTVGEIRYWRGKAYGVPCGCYTDISREIKRERGTRVYPTKEEEVGNPFQVDGPS